MLLAAVLEKLTKVWFTNLDKILYPVEVQYFVKPFLFGNSELVVSGIDGWHHKLVADLSQNPV